VGYTTATQDAAGTIHVVTSKNKPNYEIELNEAWVLDKDAGADCVSGPVTVAKSERVTERLPGGAKAEWSAGKASDGRVLLDGPEQVSYANGKPMYSVSFKAGQKTGEEKYLREDGTPYWAKTYAGDGSWTWLNFDASGKQIAESKWRGKTLVSSDVPDPPARKGEKPAAPDAE